MNQLKNYYEKFSVVFSFACKKSAKFKILRFVCRIELKASIGKLLNRSDRLASYLLFILNKWCSRNDSVYSHLSVAPILLVLIAKILNFPRFRLVYCK